MWCWRANHTWEAYEEEHSQQIEAAFRANRPSVAVDVGGYVYDVDLLKQRQVNHVTGYRRGLWRCSEEMPENVPLLMWMVDGEYMDLVTCSFLSIRRNQGFSTCIFYYDRSDYELDFINMTRRNITTGAVAKVCIVEEIPPIMTQKGLLESDIIQETPTSSEETCCICLDNFEEIPGIRLRQCVGHWFHRECVEEAFKTRHKCPMCSAVYAPAIGIQPPGQMRITHSSESLPGFEGCGLTKLYYVFPSGYQTQLHPHPGHPYYGTTRVAYLPDNREGNDVLKLLVEAWRKRLVFTVGRSMTTGMDDSVVWNGIHHKTSTNGGPTNHGYPDPLYLDSVTKELANFGIGLDEMVVD
ncbi:hypothetical protein BSKO_01376 [Bryopsis sp. KO-2023]|nr:hypothetical protein BSKO_01376 [Bryopsis sp. KO-2023]